MSSGQAQNHCVPKWCSMTGAAVTDVAVGIHQKSHKVRRA